MTYEMKTVIDSVVLVGAYPLSKDCIHGGVESSVYGLAKELCKIYKINVFDMPRIGIVDSVEQDDVSVSRYANHGRHNEDMLQREPEYVRDIVALHPDIVHIHGTSEFCRRLYLDLVGSGCRCLVTIHGLLAVEKRKSLLRALRNPAGLPKAIYQYFRQSRSEYNFLKVMKEAIVDTEYVSDALGVYPVRHLPSLQVIPQGIDERFYNLHCDIGNDTILAVGSITHRKGHVLLVEAFNIACRRGLKAKLHIMGVVGDAMYYNQLKEVVSHSPFASSIKLTANASQNELEAAYRSARIFALHTQEESQGIAFAEAMAAGLPVVATNVGGVPFVVHDGGDGLLCRFGDTDSFAKNMKELMENDAEWSRFSHSAIERAKQFNWSTVAEQIRNVYLSIDLLPKKH